MAQTYKYLDREINYREAQGEARTLQKRAGISNHKKKCLGLKHVGWINVIQAIEHYLDALQSYSGLTEEQRLNLQESNPELLNAIEDFAAAAKSFEEEIDLAVKGLENPKYEVDGNLISIKRNN